MRKRLLIVFVGIIIFIFFLSRHRGCGIIEKIYRVRSAKARVHVVLQGIQMREDGTGTVGDQQLALCRWYADSGVIGDLDALNRASDDFDTWRKGANFYLSDYSIDEVEIEKRETPEQNGEEKAREPKPWVFIVRGKIDGVTYIMRVPEGDTISWIESPWLL